MPTAAEIGSELYDERQKLAKWLDANKNDAGQLTLDADGVKRLRTWNDELGKKNQSLKDAQDIEGIAEENQKGIRDLDVPRPTMAGGRDNPSGKPGDGKPEQRKSLGELLTSSAQFKESQHLSKGASGPALEIDLAQYGKNVWAKGIAELKTVFDTGSSFTIQNIRLPQPLTPAEQQVKVAALIPQGRTSGNAVLYMEETTTTPSAAETAESGSKPEAALVFTEKTSNVRKIAVSLPITDESLEDVPFIESYIDSRLSLFVAQREDSQLLVGNGTAPNLRGILNVSGILTQARGGDPNQDAIFKAGIKIQSQGFLDPTGVVLHPNNWQTIRLMTTADGIYLFGPPSGDSQATFGTGPGGTPSMWGWDVVTTTAITANTGLVGAFRTAAEIFRRSDLSLQIGWVNDQFIKNQRTIVVEERLALVVFRPKGFCSVTSLN